ncbi:hypothetical protein TALC_00900 [Thermoplasmatales archaeon BRNA1]|nr:hypothetical protein TALC_00900 [Thermoplasmatales archaeon BRNA1]
MFNPEKDLNRIIVECLGKDGLSISSLDKKLAEMGIKDHRLILTGYLRAMTDLGYLRMKDVPPSKIYVPAKKLPESVYQSVDRLSRTYAGKDTDEIVLYVLYRLFKRPVFELELRMAGTMRPVGNPADAAAVEEGRKILKKSGNVVPTGNAYVPSKDYVDEYEEILAQITIENLDANHLVMKTKQTRLM